MLDIVQKQADILGVLQCSSLLQNVNVQSYRKMVLAKEINFAKIFQTPRNGRSGAGVLVEMPKATCPRPNVTGPIIDWIFPVLVCENPTINFVSTTGTQLAAEQLVQMVLDCVHLFADDATGTLQADSNCIEPTTEIPGCVSYRVNFKLIGKTTQSQRVRNITIAITTGNATLTCPDAADIYYTTDGTFPVNGVKVGGSTAQLYSAPFVVNTGDVIRAVGYIDNLNNSAVTQVTAP